jgi:hypothetical protein
LTPVLPRGKLAPIGDRGAPLDSIARDLATGQISRRTALKRFALATVAAAIPGGLFAESAFGACPKSRRCQGKCCTNHAHCHHGKCRCNKGYTRCGKRCKNLLTDEKNCGSCGHRCPEGKVCRNGHCKALAECQGAGDCPQAAAGSCQQAVCVSGNCGFAADDSNLPVDGNQCTQDLCSGGVPSHPPEPISTTCNQDGGSHCDGAGNCVPASCVDGIQNEGETDIDCGGPNCAGCANGKNCLGDTDCSSGICNNGTCVECVSGPDCPSGVCSSFTCAAATCTDAFKNGSETDIDCGGPDCPGCVAGKSCLADTDCASGHCCSGTCRDIQTDGNNCGSCGQACTNAHGTTACSSGTCQPICSSGFVSCNGPNDGCECAGTACCGAACQTGHLNCIGAGCGAAGLGQTYRDCYAQGTPGNAATYNATMASDARAASNVAGTDISASCPGSVSALARYNNSECVVWAYSGATAGYVFPHIASGTNGNNCQCPTVTDPTWN